MLRTPKTFGREQAVEMALAALSFMAEDRDRLVRFLDLTGLSPDELRAQAQSPELLAAVLDHLLGDESALLVFTASAGIDPAQVGPARNLLSKTR